MIKNSHFVSLEREVSEILIKIGGQGVVGIISGNVKAYSALTSIGSSPFSNPKLTFPAHQIRLFPKPLLPSI